MTEQARLASESPAATRLAETDGARWADWGAPPRRSWTPYMIATVVAWVVGGALFGLGQFVTPLRGLIGFGTVFVATFAFNIARQREVRTSLESDDPDERPVSVRLGHGKESSEDAGLLSLVDGWLLFRGERTTWSVRATDVTLDSEFPGKFDFPRPDGGTARVSLHEIRREWRTATPGYAFRVEQLVAEWKVAESAPGPPRFPPGRPAPDPAPSRGWAGILALAPAAAAFVLFFGSSPAVAALVGSGTIGLGVICRWAEAVRIRRVIRHRARLFPPHRGAA